MNCFSCNIEISQGTSKKALLDGDEIFVCCECHEQKTVVCSCCGKSIFFLRQEEQARYSYYPQCNECFLRESDTDEYGVLDYCFKPIPKFRGGIPSRDLLFMGIELEMSDAEDEDKVCEFARSILNYEKYGYSFFYGKGDGSLNDYSVEVVSHPATLEFHKETPVWQRMLNAANEAGLKSNDTDCCGIHVHVNSNYFTRDQINKLDALVNRNSRTFRRFARRHARTYARYQRDKSMDRLGVNSHGRYSCLNIGEHTIEFRIFKGNMSYNSIMAIFELIQGTCDFVKQDHIDVGFFFGDKYTIKKTFKEYLESRNFTYLPRYTEMCRVWRDLEQPEQQEQDEQNEVGA